MKQKLNTNQTGIAHLMLILAVVVLLGVGGVGYYVWNKSQEDKKSSASTLNQAAGDECKKSIDDKDFCKFVSNWSYGKEQKMTMTSGDESTVFETDASGNTRMVSIKAGSEVAAFISIGKISYVKDAATGNWTKYTSEATDTPSAEPNAEVEQEFDFEEEIAKDTSKITAQGKEACGNLNCFKYLITDSASPDEETTVLFDDKDYKLRKMVGKTAEGSVEFTFSYDVSAISEPSPVVEAPDFSNMTAEEMQQLMEQYQQ